MNQQEKDRQELLTNEVLRAQSAEAVLNNSEFKRFFDEYRGDLFRKIMESKGDEIDKREEFYRQLKSLGIMEANLTRAINTGKMARDEMTRLQKLTAVTRNVVGL